MTLNLVQDAEASVLIARKCVAEVVKEETTCDGTVRRAFAEHFTDLRVEIVLRSGHFASLARAEAALIVLAPQRSAYLSLGLTAGLYGKDVRYARKRSRCGCLRSHFWDLGLHYLPGPVRLSASIRLARISLMRVRWPSPLARSQTNTCGSRRTLTARRSPGGRR